MNPEELARHISYDPETGIFTRLVASSHAKPGPINGRLNRKGYLEFWILGKLVRSHRLAFFIMLGRWPEKQIDHIDGDKANNRWANLRDVDNKTNCENKKVSYKNNTHGFLGISRRGRKWEARIRCDGKLRYLGVFPTPELAHAAYIEAKKILHKGYQV
jgi:hypothetical protein